MMYIISDSLVCESTQSVSWNITYRYFYSNNFHEFILRHIIFVDNSFLYVVSFVGRLSQNRFEAFLGKSYGHVKLYQLVR